VSRGSSVQCLTTEWTNGVRSPTEAEDFSSGFCIQTGSGAHPASFLMGVGGPFPGGNVQPCHNADHSPPPATEINNEQVIPPVFPSPSVARSVTFILLCGEVVIGCPPVCVFFVSYPSLFLPILFSVLIVRFPFVKYRWYWNLVTIGILLRILRIDVLILTVPRTHLV
jgi:hypothetical protein